MRTVMAMLLVMGCVSHGYAASSDTPVVINTGEATAYALPGTATFTITKEFSEADIKASMEKCGAFIAQAQQDFRAGEVSPQEISVLPPTLVDINSKVVRGGIRVGYSMSTYNSPSTGPVAFGLLCDKIIAMTANLGAKSEGPVLECGDREAIAANAVSQATANAYSHAETVAFALKCSVYLVESAEVLDVVWSQKEPAAGEVPQVGCTARVKVVYQLAPQQN